MSVTNKTATPANPMLELTKFKRVQDQVKHRYWILFILTLLIGLFYIINVARTQDEEMRDNLITYAKTI